MNFECIDELSWYIREGRARVPFAHEGLKLTHVEDAGAYIILSTWTGPFFIAA